MTTHNVSITDFAAVFKRDMNKRFKGMEDACYLSAVDSAKFVAKSSPVFLGMYRNSHKAERVKDGGVLGSDAPYSGVLENGARPHPVSQEGFENLVRWVIKKIPIKSAAAWRVKAASKKANRSQRAKRTKNVLTKDIGGFTVFSRRHLGSMKVRVPSKGKTFESIMRNRGYRSRATHTGMQKLTGRGPTGATLRRRKERAAADAASVEKQARKIAEAIRRKINTEGAKPKKIYGKNIKKMSRNLKRFVMRELKRAS